MPPVAMTTRPAAKTSEPLIAFDENPRHRVVLDKQAPGRGALDQGDRWRFTHLVRQGAHDFAAARIPAGMHDAAARMGGFKAKNKPALAIAIKRNAALDQLRDCRRGRGEDRTGDRLIANSIAGLERVGKMKGKIIVRRKARGNSALRENARRFKPEWRLAQENDRFRRERESGGQTRKATAHDNASPVGLAGIHHCTSSMRSTARRAGAAICGSMCTSCCIVSSARLILRSEIFFICGQRLQGRINSRSG